VFPERLAPAPWEQRMRKAFAHRHGQARAVKVQDWGSKGNLSHEAGLIWVG